MARMKKAPTQRTRGPSRQGDIPKGREAQASRSRGQKAPKKGRSRGGRKVGARPKRAPAPPR